MVGDVCRKVGRVAVGADEHFVLFAAELGCLVPDSAVFFVSEAAVAQVIDDGHDFAVLVQVTFEEPAVVMDAVFFHIGLHFRDVLRQAEADECLAALFFGDVHQFIAVLFGVLFGEVKNVFAVVAVLRELRRIFREELLVANGEGETEFIELIAGVVDVKLTPNVVACGIQNGGEAIAERAAAGVAHVHGARGVGGNKLDHDLAVVAVVASAVCVVLCEHFGQHIAVKRGAEEEVHEAGAGGLGLNEVGAVEVEIFHDSRGDFRGRHAECTRGSHGGVRCEITVRAVCRAFYGESGQLCFGQHARSHRFFHRRFNDGRNLFFCNAYCFRHRGCSFRFIY